MGDKRPSLASVFAPDLPIDKHLSEAIVISVLLGVYYYSLLCVHGMISKAECWNCCYVRKMCYFCIVKMTEITLRVETYCLREMIKGNY